MYIFGLQALTLVSHFSHAQLNITIFAQTLGSSHKILVPGIILNGENGFSSPCSTTTMEESKGSAS
jgi:hypothetical protein